MNFKMRMRRLRIWFEENVSAKGDNGELPYQLGGDCVHFCVEVRSYNIAFLHVSEVLELFKTLEGAR
jgi:hypothetical protein